MDEFELVGINRPGLKTQEAFMLKYSKKRHLFIRIMLIAYAIAMAYFLFFRRSANLGGTYWEHISMNINMVPFYTIKQNLHLLLKQSNPYLVPYAVLNLCGNVIGFIPFGIILPILLKQTRKFKTFLFYAIGSIILIELIQLFTLRGSCDIDDLILNLLGSFMGYIINCFTKLSACFSD